LRLNLLLKGLGLLQDTPLIRTNILILRDTDATIGNKTGRFTFKSRQHIIPSTCFHFGSTDVARSIRHRLELLLQTTSTQRTWSRTTAVFNRSFMWLRISLANSFSSLCWTMDWAIWHRHAAECYESSGPDYSRRCRL